MSLSHFATEDYQNRNGRYPRAGVPDTIDAGDNWLGFSFKNTDERTAQNWVTRFMQGKGLQPVRVEVNQTGDYQNDWVDVFVEVRP